MVDDYRQMKQRKKTANSIKSIVNDIGTSIVLVLINKAVSPHHFWAKIPLLIIACIIIFKVIKLVGQLVAENLAANPATRSGFKEDILELKNEIDLNELSHQHKGTQKLWKDSELVKSNLL